MIDAVFQQLFGAIPFAFFVGIMGTTILFETFYTFFENIDML